MIRLFTITALCLWALPTLAGSTRSFRVTSYKDLEEGEASGVLLSSLGDAASGFSSSRVDLAEAVVYSSASAPDGTVYFGTGDEGVIYIYQKGKAKQLCKLDAVLVSALAIGDRGRLFVGAMPGGKIYAVERDGKTREVARLDAEHVWGLAYDEAKQTLYAATGPEGRLFAIDVSQLDRPQVQSRARMIYDSGEKHLLSLVRSDDGALYAGSAGQAILYRIMPSDHGAPVETRALHDFEGDEIPAIARKGSVLYVAVTSSRRGPRTCQVRPAPCPRVAPRWWCPPHRRLPYRPRHQAATGRARGRCTGSTRTAESSSCTRLPTGTLRRSMSSRTAMSMRPPARTAASPLHPNRTVQTALDLPERQVLTLAFSGPEHLLGTGDTGAIYRVSNEPPKNAAWTSKVFDAQFHSHFGNVRWSGSGGLIVETRAGNTSHPDKTWSSWQAPLNGQRLAEGGVGKAASPDGRYLQARVHFTSKSELRDLTLYYQPQNQRARVTEIVVGDESIAKRSAAQRAQKPHSPLVKLRWKIENPDEDELVYRLWYREEGELNWKPIGGPEPLTRTEYDWNTESIPDGNYEVRVVASDERANPPEDALEHELTSAPFLVDNRKPELGPVQVNYPYASGRAHDSFSALTELAYSIDGGDWQPFSPRDGVLDDPTEEFTVKLPSGLQAGVHSLAIRALDAADNVGATQITFRVNGGR